MHHVHGSGTINENDKDIEKIFTKELIKKTTSFQVALLKKAISMLKPQKEMVYSTCSILSCENEEIVEQVLKNAKAKIVPIELQNMEKIPLLPTKIKGSICIKPTLLYEGFFIVKIRKE